MDKTMNNNQNTQKKFKIGDQVYYIDDGYLGHGEILSIRENNRFTIEDDYCNKVINVFTIYSSREEAENALSRNRIKEIRNGVAEWRLDDKKEHENLQKSVNNLYSELRRINGELSDITDRLKKHYLIKESSVFKSATFFFITTIVLLGTVIALLLR